MMTDVFYFIADMFQFTFNIIPIVGDYINWLYIFIITAFLFKHHLNNKFYTNLLLVNSFIPIL